MPPSTRRLRHIPSWVDEGLLLSGAAATDDGPAVTSISKDPLTMRGCSTDSGNNVGVAQWLMVHRVDDGGCSIRSRNVAAPLRFDGGGDDDGFGRHGSAGGSSSSPPPQQNDPQQLSSAAAMNALQHCLDKACHSNNHNHHASVAFCSPDDPLDVVSRYNGSTRQTKADVHAVFEDAMKTAAAHDKKGLHSNNTSAPRTASSVGASAPATSVAVGCSSTPTAHSSNVHRRIGGGTEEHAPPQQQPPASVGLPLQDLMLQLAARGAISEGALREFMAFKPMAASLGACRVTVGCCEGRSALSSTRHDLLSQRTQRTQLTPSPSVNDPNHRGGAYEPNESGGTDVVGSDGNGCDLVPLLSRHRPSRSITSGNAVVSSSSPSAGTACAHRQGTTTAAVSALRVNTVSSVAPLAAATSAMICPDKHDAIHHHHQVRPTVSAADKENNGTPPRDSGDGAAAAAGRNSHRPPYQPRQFVRPPPLPAASASTTAAASLMALMGGATSSFIPRRHLDASHRHQAMGAGGVLPSSATIEDNDDDERAFLRSVL